MISPSLTDTELRLDKGRATVEVAELHPQNNIIIVQHATRSVFSRPASTILTPIVTSSAFTRARRWFGLLKPGYPSQGWASARARRWWIAESREIQQRSGPGRSLSLEQPAVLLYRRSQRRSRTNLYHGRLVRFLVGIGIPYFSCYTFIPGDGIFYSPFGWGFLFSPFSLVGRRWLLWPLPPSF